MRIAVCLLLAAVALAGCVDQSAGAQKSKAEEFSAEGFEEEMIKAGKQDELDEAKRREAEYLAAEGGQPSQGEEPK
jgi:hypothetical protein